MPPPSLASIMAAPNISWKVRIPIMASWTTIKSIPKVYPLAFGVVFSTFKTSFRCVVINGFNLARCG